MTYFRLIDDVHVPGRWHLAAVILADGSEPDLLDSKALGPLESRPKVKVSTPGRPLEFCETSFAIPVASKRLERAIAEVAAKDYEPLPVTIGQSEDFVVLNVTRVVACVDESRSEFSKWTLEDERPDLLGQYSSIIGLHIDPAVVPFDAHMFRLAGWPVGLIVSARVKDAMERSGCVGATFLDVVGS